MLQTLLHTEKDGFVEGRHCFGALQVTEGAYSGDSVELKVLQKCFLTVINEFIKIHFMSFSLYLLWDINLPALL